MELDHRVLAGARADMDDAGWARVLKDAGVTRVPLTEPPPGVAGRAVEDAREARRLVDGLAATQASTAVARRGEQIGVAAALVGVATLALGGLPLALGIGAVGGALALWQHQESVRQQQQGMADWLRQRRELHGRVRALAGRTFVALLGEDTLVINTPHLTFLEARIHDVDRAWGRMLDRDRALARLRAEMVASNTSLGRDAEDSEVQAIDAERARIEEAEPAFRILRDRLEARLHKAQENVEYLAEIGRRQALSRQLGGVLDASVQDSLADLAASLEIDIAGVEAELQRLDVSLSDADASLRALLEVEALGRPK